MSDDSTPAQSNKKKRVKTSPLSSPEFAAELKKQCRELKLFSASVPDCDLEEPKPTGCSTMAGLESSPRVSPGVSDDSPERKIVLSADDIQGIATALERVFQNKLVDMVKSITEGVLQGITGELENLQTENRALKAENSMLKSQITDLQKSQDAAEQYSRRNNLRISGVPESQGESTDKLVLKLADAVGANITIDEIDRSHRVGKPTVGKTRDIIVKMATYRSRQKIMNQRKLAKDRGYNRVFINEDLTRARSIVYFHARGLDKAGKLQGAWTSDGTVLVKDRANAIRRVTCEQDLSPFSG